MPENNPSSGNAAVVNPLGLGKICVVIGRVRHKMMQIEIQEAVKAGAKLIEVRLDFVARPDFHRLLENKTCPMIATVRRASDGGRFTGGEVERLALLRQAIVSGFDWVDLETDIIDQVRRFKDVKRIVSFHSLRAMPENLEQIYKKMCEQDADVVKIAVCAHDQSDNLRVLDLLRNAPKPTVALCTGDLGLPSRILGPCLGAAFTYGGVQQGTRVAPGLPSWDDLQHLYYFDQITPQTAIYGVIGDPVAHSLSPLIHNKAFRKVGIDAVYVPFRVSRSMLQGFLKTFERLGVRGYSVTIPHKDQAATVADKKDESVLQIQAANTLLRTDKGWMAYNTDAQAAFDTITTHLPEPVDGSRPSLAPLCVLLLGAGGVAKAVAHALRREVNVMTIANRTGEKAHHLAEQNNCRVVDWGARHSVYADLVVNCTSVGMHPNTDESPLHPSYLKQGMIVFDAIYTPQRTLLVKEALDRGCHVIPGIEMFVRQAALQFNLFTGREAPIECMREVIQRALSPVAIKEDTGDPWMVQ